MKKIFPISPFLLIQQLVASLLHLHRLAILSWHEPNALICFAGPRVIEQFFGKALPEGAQQSEFLLEHGMIDLIVKRHKMKEVVADILEFATINIKDSIASHLDNMIQNQKTRV